MDNMRFSSGFQNIYDSLAVALEANAIDSKTFAEIAEIVRLVLSAHNSARTDAEKTQLRNLVERVEALNGADVEEIRSNVPSFGKVQQILWIWKNRLLDDVDVTAQLDSVLRDVTSRGRECILGVLKGISADLRSDVMEKAMPILRGIENGHDRAVVLRLIGHIPTELRSDSVEKILSVLEGIENGYQIKNILETVEGISPEEIIDVIEKSGPFFRDIDGYDRSDLLDAVAAIPRKRRTEVVIRSMDSLLRGIQRGGQKTGILSALQNLAEEDRVDVIERATSIFEGITNGYRRAAVIYTIGRVPSELRSDFMEQVSVVLEGTAKDDARADIVSATGNVSWEQRAEVIQKVLPLFKNITDGSLRADILDAVALIPRERRTASVIRSTAILLREVESGYSRESVLEDLRRFPADQRGDIIEKALLVLEGVTNSDQNVNIFSLIGKLSAELRSDIIEKALSLFKGVTSGYERIGILGEIREIFIKQRAYVFEKAGPFLQGFAGGAEKATMLRIIQRIPSERIEEAIDFTKTCKSLTKESALNAWAFIPVKGSVRIWKGFLKQLDKIHDPLLQYQIFSVFQRATQSPSVAALFESPTFDTLFSNEHSQVFRLYVAYLWAGRESNVSLRIVADVLNSKQCKDADKKKSILRAFHSLLRIEDLSPPEKMNLLTIAFSTPAKSGSLVDKIVASLLLIETICNLGRVFDLKEIENEEDLESLLKEALKEILGQENRVGFFEHYLETFGSFRDPTSLSVYMGKMKTLPQSERGKASEALKCYVEEVLNGTFPVSRYEESSSEHLLKVFEKRQELKRRWMEGRKMNFEELCSVGKEIDSSRTFDLREYLRQRILVDRHISHEKIPYSVACLQEEESNSTKLDDAIKRGEQAVTSDPENQTLRQALGLLRLQKGIFSLLREEGGALYDIFRSKVEPFIETALLEEEQFKSDLIGLGKMLDPRVKTNSFVGWIVVDTDDPQDLLLCGTEVEGSCQNVRGSPALNKCLLGYLLDGKNRLIAVKNDKGRIVARAILRLLWDEKEQVPVLFRERVYTASHADAKTLEALDRMSLLRAQELKLPLVTASLSGSECIDYPNELKSLGSRSPFEYSDGGSGPTNGTFRVQGILVADFSE